ncbi:Cytoplasmic axial filament protein CafA and Ribonuclease G [Planctomycetales bacterium 10988]|nr:Cytoplasmic axial filament protein CafA and Ribonuclease G [Planctomycetales bacterium 10988]
MKCEMLINARQPEEIRVAIVEDHVLEELYTERIGQENYVGNIYKGKIVNLEPSIQAAFVDFGVGRNGFLHISDVEPRYFRQGGYPLEEIQAHANQNDDDSDDGDERPQRGRPMRGGIRPRFKPPIQEIFRRGDEVLVQVIKEGIGTKGPTLSTYISIPGRYLVLMPALGRVGVSRKIEDEDVRKKMREIMLELDPPKGLGFIVRTAGADRSRKELARDMAYLLRLWRVIVRRIKTQSAPVDIYEESDMIIRTIRDVFTAEVDSIQVDEEGAYNRAKEFLQLVMPRYVNRLHLYDGKDPLYHKYSIEEEIARINQREVPLKHGGSIVIDQTEALVAIDVNSGNFRSENGNAEETAYHLNMAAAKEIARQLRLRDLGGVVVNDFIDMRKEKHRRSVEKSLREAVKRDRARTKILRTSPFGLVEMTRQRIRPSLKSSLYRECPCCRGTGVVKTPESMGVDVLRILMSGLAHENVDRVVIEVHEEVASYLNNRKRQDLATLEQQGNMWVEIVGKANVWPEHFVLKAWDAMAREIKFHASEPSTTKV